MCRSLRLERAGLSRDLVSVRDAKWDLMGEP